MPQLKRRYELADAVQFIDDQFIEKQVRHNPGAPVLLGISGIDCSGKSTLAKELTALTRQTGIRTELIQIDDFIIPSDQRTRVGPADIDYFEHTFDQTRFANRVNTVASDGKPQLVIGEGVFLFRREMVNRWHTRVWLEMSVEKAIECGSVRDADYFGSTDIARNEYLERFMPAHEYHIERDRPAESAHLVLKIS